jgi:putative transposase
VFVAYETGFHFLIEAGWRMAKAYSADLRERVQATGQNAASSQAEVATRFGVSESFGRDLSRRLRATGSAAAKPHGDGRRLAADPKTWPDWRRWWPSATT